MKVLAIIDVAQDAQIETVRAELRKELEGSWKLFACGDLREAYATGNPRRVVFVLEAADVASAGQRLRTLPLVARGLMHVELIELRPFENWSLLFAP